MYDYPNYAKLDYYRREHRRRYKRRVEETDDSLVCQECGGEGGWTEIIDYWLGGPWYD